MLSCTIFCPNRIPLPQDDIINVVVGQPGNELQTSTRFSPTSIGGAGGGGSFIWAGAAQENPLRRCIQRSALLLNIRATNTDTGPDSPPRPPPHFDSFFPSVTSHRNLRQALLGCWRWWRRQLHHGLPWISRPGQGGRHEYVKRRLSFLPPLPALVPAH